MNENIFAKGVERLINPINVGAMHFIQGFNSLLPRKVQNMLMQSTSKKIPSMGFVVEPYSFFLCYEIADLEKAKELLPANFALAKTKIFDDDEPKYYCIFGCIRAHTSAFWGSRVEFYIIAEDQQTHLLSWIIVDYDTNSISYDKKNGLRSPNSSKAIITINHRGRLFVDVPRDDNSRKLVFDSNIESGTVKKIDQRLWLEGNLSIGYGKVLSEDAADIFSLKFEPLEVEKALTIPLNEFNLEANTWFPGLFKDTPSQLVCFPYAQHFVSDSPGYASNLKTKEELELAAKSIDFEHTKVFSTKYFRTMFLVGMAVSFITTAVLVAALIVK